MSEQVKLIDAKVKEEVLRYPLVDIIRKLFPDVAVHGRGRSVMCNPLRGEKHPSLSCFRDYAGVQRWKDHATGETGDNLDFYRKAFPQFGYVEALDRLSLLVLGKSVLADYVPGRSVPFYSDLRRMRRVRPAVSEDISALNIISSDVYSLSRTPKSLIEYVRGRGISDRVAERFLSYVVYENLNRKGKTLIDEVSGLPLLGEDGRVMKDPARYEAIGMVNDIGGYSLRVPPSGDGQGFKGSNVSFITTLFARTFLFPDTVSFVGEGDGFVSQFLYDAGRGYLSVNSTQGFNGIVPELAGTAMAFLDRWIGRYLEGRELKGAVAVLNALSGPLAPEVDVVEGMFDAVSDIEFERVFCGPARPARDIVVLNSISNLHWAVPFLSVHGVVRSLLDNDMVSSAGRKAYELLCAEVDSFSKRIGRSCQIRSDSSLFYPCKDINDFLMVKKGFRTNVVEVKDVSSFRKVEGGSSKRKNVKQVKP